VLLGGHTFEARDGSEKSQNSGESSASARDRFVSLAAARPPGRGLLSVSNHTSTLDDPGLFAAMLPLSLFATDHLGGIEEEKESGTESGRKEESEKKREEQGNLVGGGRAVRWSLCASDICFNKGKFISDFFLAGKTLPVERFGRKGVAQPATEAAAEVLRGGGWVHLFPEGRVELSGRLPPAASSREEEEGGGGDSGSTSSFSSSSSLYSSTKTLLSRAWGLVASGQPSKKREGAAAAGEEEEKSKQATATATTTTTTTTKPPPPPRRKAFRRGVGALYCDCLNKGGQPPILLPFYHSGMAEVMPRKGKIPRVFNFGGSDGSNDDDEKKKIVVVVGEEVDVSDLNAGCSSPDEGTRKATWAAIAERLRRELVRLEEKAPRNRDQRSELEKEREEGKRGGGGGKREGEQK